MTFNVRVFNKESKRTDYHYNLTKDDISWISTNENLSVEILSEDFVRGRKETSDTEEE